eukprot:m.9884 g.9884  ORF g.9884 m.9884 type:complete len:136 (+) comp21712_c0_seq2:52-459(+)
MRFVTRITVVALSAIALALMIIIKPWSRTREVVVDPHVELMGDLWDPVPFPADKKAAKAQEKKAPFATTSKETAARPPSAGNPIRLSVVVCGDRAKETLVLLKSAAMFSKTRQFYHLFAEDHAKVELSKETRGLT